MDDWTQDEIDDEMLQDDAEELEAEANCGQTPDGRCQLAGTEYCDWSCPFSSELGRTRIKRMKRVNREQLELPSTGDE